MEWVYLQANLSCQYTVKTVVIAKTFKKTCYILGEAYLGNCGIEYLEVVVTREDIYETAVALIRRNLEEKHELTDAVEAMWKKKLISSITYVLIIVDLETEFDIEISDDYLFRGSLKTIDDLVDYIKEIV